jgi:hypothetical protein
MRLSSDSVAMKMVLGMFSTMRSMDPPRFRLRYYALLRLLTAQATL